MSKPKSYADILWPVKKDEKKLDKQTELSYSNKTEENTVKDLNCDYKAYCIIKKAPKQYVVAEVSLDSGQGVAAPEVIFSQVYDSEKRAVLEMQKLFSEQGKKFRKD